MKTQGEKLEIPKEKSQEFLSRIKRGLNIYGQLEGMNLGEEIY